MFCRLLVGLLLSCMCTVNRVHTATTVQTATAKPNGTDVLNATTPVTPRQPVPERHTYSSDPNTISMDSDDDNYNNNYMGNSKHLTDMPIGMGEMPTGMPIYDGGIDDMPIGMGSLMTGKNMHNQAGDICDSIMPGTQIPWMCYCRFCKGAKVSKGDQGLRGLPGT